MAAAPAAPDTDPADEDARPPDRLFSLGDLLLARRPRLLVTPAIIAIDVAVFVAMVAQSGGPMFSSPTLVRWGGLFPAAVVDGQWWRLLTSMWLHAHPLHLVLNLVFLWQLGSIVERMLGPLVFLIVYLLAGVLATAVSLQTLAGNGVSVGASGAIFGLVGVLLAVAVTSRRIHGLGRLMADLQKRLIGVVLANLVAGFLIPGIDNGAHVGGLVAGLLLGWLVGRDAVTTTPPLRRTFIPLALTTILAATSIFVVTRAAGQAIAVEREHFTERNRAAEASFRTAIADVRAGRRTAADAARTIEAALFPDLRAAEARSDVLLRSAQSRYLATPPGDRRDGPHGRRVDPTGRAYHEAYEWVIFLARYDEAWRLRLRGLRDGDAARIAEGDARAERAVRIFATRWAPPDQTASPP